LTEGIVALARRYGPARLRDAGWHVNRKHVERT
jgi:hypothetical protein